MKDENKKSDGGLLKPIVRFLKTIAHGELISSSVYKRNWVLVVIFVFIMVIYISSRYRVQTQVATIIKLKKELANAETDKVRVSAFYNSNIREPMMRARADSAGLNLIMPDQPPYNLTKKH